ncbi:MAG: hypothetical protein KatS3mg018_1634 [Fimbriimonadales bacterium]|nr:MAG: hypothetical protein KatS3mg018_1634 [Fimbriimonadales bacterium]
MWWTLTATLWRFCWTSLLEALEELEAIQAYDEAKASGQQPVPLEEALRSLEESRS